MPCNVPHHNHCWTTQGELVIHGCETLCGFCEGPAASKDWRYTWFLARHVRSQHTRDFPELGPITTTKKERHYTPPSTIVYGSGGSSPEAKPAVVDQGRLGQVTAWLEEVADRAGDGNGAGNGMALCTGLGEGNGGMFFGVNNMGGNDDWMMGPTMVSNGFSNGFEGNGFDTPMGFGIGPYDDIVQNNFGGIGGLPTPPDLSTNSESYISPFPFDTNGMLDIDVLLNIQPTHEPFLLAVKPTDPEKADKLYQLFQTCGEMGEGLTMPAEQILYVLREYAQALSRQMGM